MSDTDSDTMLEHLNPSGELLLEAAQSSSAQRRSVRIAQAEYEFLYSQLKASGISPAPGLQLSQLKELASLVSISGSPNGSSASGGEAAGPSVSSRGRKRSRSAATIRPKKRISSRAASAAASNPAEFPAAHSAPPAAAAVGTAPRAAAAPPAADGVYTAPPVGTAAGAAAAAGAPPVAAAAGTAAAAAAAAAAPHAAAVQDIILSNIQQLVRSVQNIDSRLRSVESASAPSLQSVVSLPAINNSIVSPPQSLASAVPAPMIGRPYIPTAANISPSLRQKILQGKYVNLVSIILPSPECDQKISSNENVSVILKSSDPRMSRDLSIGEFLVAFGIYRDVICAVYPERRIELDAYLALIGDLNIRYGKNLFYQYHKAFANKAALHISQSNLLLNWSVLDSEILIMLIGGSQAVSCHLCGNLGHPQSLCPQLPFTHQASRSADPSSSSAPSAPSMTDKRGRKRVQGCAPQISVPPPSDPSASGTRSAIKPAQLKKLLKIHPSTPLNVQALAAELLNHPDSSFTNHLLTGLSQGFRVGVVALPDINFVSKNLQSATNEPDIVTQLLGKELNKGYLIGPFDSPPFPVFRTSPIGVATRKYSGKKRLIFDLSAPRSGPIMSVNSLIPPVPFSLHYSTVDNAIKLIKIAGRGAWLSKADITDAFKIVPIHPSQWHLFGVKWDQKFYFAVRLTFGCRSSPFIFNLVSEALCWILLNNIRLPAVLHLLDDFLLIDPPHDNSCSSLTKLKQLFNKLGVPLSDEKTLGPATSLEFLGITLDTSAMKASLPEQKLERIRSICQSLSSSGSFSKQQLLSLLGHLNFAMRIIPQGRSFISRLLDLASSVPNLHDQLELDEGCRSDLKFWSELLDQWNGISFFYDDIVHSSDAIQFFTDAAPSVGFGGFYQGQWFADHWPPSFSELDFSSALYEIYPIAVACHVWGHLWHRKRIAVLCDNQAVVEIINKGRSSSCAIMPFMRRITWLSVNLNFIITARHVPGQFNAIADSLSRFKFQVFRNLCPDANTQPTPVPSLNELALY
ncbi:uncharacterized protein LOC141800545 [Halichoeres trimaculatus]|uniref:uncharacterized protein LOC141800545 n=1 Tax=Halichoeres trimaculatus TaxID=147232 RepID=UPI003D9FA0C4